MNGYKKFTSVLYGINNIISKIELTIMTVSIVIMTGVMLWQAVTRYFVGIPATWAEELCRYLFIWMSFLGSAYAVWTSEHIEIDLIDTVIRSKFGKPEKIIAVMRKIVLVVIIVFSGYFFNLYFGYVQQIAKLTQYSGAMKINMVYPMSSGVVGLALIIFHAVSLLLMPEKEKEEA